MAGIKLEDLMVMEQMQEEAPLAVDKDQLIAQIESLLSNTAETPRMQGGGQPPPMGPPAVPSVGGGLPSVADNMRNSMPPARPMPPPPPQGAGPMGPPPQDPQQMAGMPPMDPEVEDAVNRTMEMSETPDEALTSAMASSVVSFADSPEEIIDTFDRAKEQALMQFSQITGSPDAGMSDTDARLMELLGGGEGMMAPEEMMMSEEIMI